MGIVDEAIAGAATKFNDAIDCLDEADGNGAEAGRDWLLQAQVQATLAVALAINALRAELLAGMQALIKNLPVTP